MDCRLPAVIERLIRSKTRVFAPGTVDEIAPTIPLRRPDQCGKRIHNAAEVELYRRVFVTDHVHPPVPSSARQGYLDAEGLMLMLRLPRESLTSRILEAMIVTLECC